MRVVVYSRVSTDEQNPKSQLEVVLKYCGDKGYQVVKIFEENISGATYPLERPVFREMVKFVKGNRVDAIVMHDLTRFWRPKNPSDLLSLLRKLMTEYNIVFDFAKEPEIEDPLLRELWMFIKSWFSFSAINFAFCLTKVTSFPEFDSLGLSLA